MKEEIYYRRIERHGGSRMLALKSIPKEWRVVRVRVVKTNKGLTIRLEPVEVEKVGGQGE